jgi:hypothetical protein
LSSFDGTTQPSTEPRPCGLLVNPFAPLRPSYDTIPMAIWFVTHLATCRLVTAARRSADSGQFKPVWVDKSAEIPPEYHVMATTSMLRLTSDPETTGTLVAYVALAFMRMGRVRAALNALSERTCGNGFELALGRYCADALAHVDAELEESKNLDPEILDGVRQVLATDPRAGAALLFGEYVEERDPNDDLEVLLRVSGARQGLLEADPEPEAESVETDEDTDSLTEAYGIIHMTPPDEGAQALEPGEPAADDDPQAEQRARQEHLGDIAAYVVAHARAHLSPVVSRALASYRARGIAAASEEFKITKAPRKTLAAVAKFAHYAYPAVVLVFDQFGGWQDIPQETRLSIATALTEMRWALADSGVIAIIAAAGDCPEIEEQFAAATRVEWDMVGLAEVSDPSKGPEALPLVEAFEAVTLCEPAVGPNDPVIAEAISRAEGDVDAFIRMMAPAVDDAMARGADRLDVSALGPAEEPVDEPAEGGEGTV